MWQQTAAVPPVVGHVVVFSLFAGSIHRSPDDEKWRAMWRDRDGRQRSKTFRRRQDAKDYLATIEAHLVPGQHIDPAAGRITLTEYTDAWIEAQHRRPSTRGRSRAHLDNHILPALGHRPIGQITRTDIQAFVTSLDRKGLAPTTVRAIYQRLVSVLQAAAHDRLILQSPAVKIQLPNRLERPSVEVLEADQVAALAEHIHPPLSAMVWTCAMSGLRIGEAAGLTAERLDLYRLELVVDGQTTTITGTGPVLSQPKTQASTRNVPIPQRLADILSEHFQRFPPAELEPGATLVFANRKGRLWRRNMLSKRFDEARDRCGIDVKGWHTLRHTYASMLIHAGLSVTAVQSRLGHASATETLDTYGHLWADSDDDTRAAVEAAFVTR